MSERSSYRITIVQQLALYSLLLSGIYQLLMIRRQLPLYRSAIELRLSAPRDASFYGIDESGHPVIFPVDATSHLEGYHGVVLTLINHKHPSHDIAYWNAVKLAGQQLGNVDHLRIGYWGICDDEYACRAGRLNADFPVVALLDPYQSHIAFTMEQRRDVLVYGQNSSLVSRIPFTQSPSAMAKAIIAAVSR